MCEICCEEKMTPIECDGNDCIHNEECEWMCECKKCGNTCGDCI